MRRILMVFLISSGLFFWSSCDDETTSEPQKEYGIEDFTGYQHKTDTIHMKRKLRIIHD